MSEHSGCGADGDPWGSRSITVAGAAPALLIERTGFPFNADLAVVHTWADKKTR